MVLLCLESSGLALSQTRFGRLHLQGLGERGRVLQEPDLDGPRLLC